MPSYIYSQWIVILKLPCTVIQDRRLIQRPEPAALMNAEHRIIVGLVPKVADDGVALRVRLYALIDVLEIGAQVGGLQVAPIIGHLNSPPSIVGLFVRACPAHIPWFVVTVVIRIPIQ